MDFSIYLAFTEAEWASVRKYGGKMAWMACRFSPWGSGISGVPTSLPPGSMLMLSDQAPCNGHDPEQVAQAFVRAVAELGCERAVLDLQRDDPGQYGTLVENICGKAECKVAISEKFAHLCDAPVLLSPPPLWTPLKDHLEKWSGREIWLEAVLDGATVTVTEAGSDYRPCAWDDLPQSHVHPQLHVRYMVQTRDRAAFFHLRRDKEQLAALLEEAQALGVHTAVGLYQQLGG